MTFALPRRRARTEVERQRRRWFRQTVLGVLTLALTPIPIIFYMAHTSDGYLMYPCGGLNLVERFRPTSTCGRG